MSNLFSNLIQLSTKNDPQDSLKLSVEKSLFALEKNLQTYVSKTALTIEKWIPTLKKWIPARIQQYVPKITQVNDLLLRNMPEVFQAKNFSDAADDKRFSESLFNSAVDNFIEDAKSGYTLEKLKNNLIELKSSVGKSTVSPFLYHDNLLDMSKHPNFVADKKFRKAIYEILKTFRLELKQHPEFVLGCFSGDLNYFLSELHNGTADLNYYLKLIRYYKLILSDLNYFTCMTNLKNYITKNSENLSAAVGKKNIKFLLNEFANILLSIDRNKVSEEEKRNLENVANFSQLPFFQLENEELEEFFLEEFFFEDQDQPQINNTSESSQNYLKTTLSLTKKALHYAVTNPLKTTMIVLNAQTVATAAFTKSALSLTKKALHYAVTNPLKTTMIVLNAQTVATAAFENVYRPYSTVKNLESMLQKRITINGVPPENQVNVNTSGVHANPFVVPNGNTYSILFDADDISGKGVYVRPYDQYGQPISAEFRLNNITLNDQTNPVGVFQNNKYCFAWQSYANDGSQFNIMTALFGSDWSVITPDTRVNTGTTGNQTGVSLAASNNTIFYAWTTDSESSFTGVVGRCMNMANNFFTTDFPINTYTNSYQQFPRVIYNPSTNEFTVTYESALQDGSGYGAYARRFTDNCVAIGSEFQVNTSPSGNQRYPDGATNGTDYFFNWEYNGDVEGKRVSSTGTSQGSQFRVNINQGGNQLNPRVTQITNGNYLSTYQCDHIDTDGGICGVEISNGGQFVGGEELLNSNTNGSQVNQHAKGFTSGDPKKAVVTWEEAGQIMARVFNTSSLEPPVSTTGEPASTTQTPVTTNQPDVTTYAMTTADQQTTSATSADLTTNDPTAVLTTAALLSTTALSVTTNNPSSSSTTYQAITTSLANPTTNNPGSTNSQFTTGDSEQVESSPKANNSALIIGGVVAGVGLLAIGTATFFVAKRKCGKKDEKRLTLLTDEVLRQLNLEDSAKTPILSQDLNQLLIKLSGVHFTKHQVSLENMDDYLTKKYAGYISTELNKYIRTENNTSYLNLVAADKSIKSISNGVNEQFALKTNQKFSV